jgi:sulfur carrier protein ThiS
MNILYINNSGGGWADYIELPEGQSVEQLFEERMTGQQPQDFLIRVNRQPVSRDTVLQEGDRVTITPLKIEGATI